MTILVTGASGFLGLNLLHHLTAAHPGATIIAADCIPPPPRDLAHLNSTRSNLFFLSLDVRSPRSCHDLLARTRPTHILHAAAVTLPEDTPSNLEQTRLTNAQGTSNLLEATAAEGTCRRAILLSSSAVYDQTLGPATCAEDHPTSAATAYAQAKLDLEAAIYPFAATTGIQTLAARIGPVFGPWERPRPSRPIASLVALLLEALTQHRTLTLSGPEVHRDWTPASEIARALDALLFAPRLHHTLYNVSSSISVSSTQILDIFRAHGLDLRPTDDPAAADLLFAPQDSRKPLDITRLRTDTSFRPTLDLTRSLQTLIAVAHP